MEDPNAYWSWSVETAFKALETQPTGLSWEEAKKRREKLGTNVLKAKKSYTLTRLFWAQLRTPIVFILICAACISFFLHNPSDALIILAIVLTSSFLSFQQEKGAQEATSKLLAMVQIKTKIIRQGEPTNIPLEEVVSGDVVLLSSGDIIPADCLLIESKDLFVDEASLTGETYPIEKIPLLLAPQTSLNKRTNTLFLGTHVISGTGRGIVVNTGKKTEFGKIAQQLRIRPIETDFEKGIRRFGYFLVEVTLLLVILIFAFNVLLSRPVLDSFLFSLALAVGLIPQLLPAIVSVNLANGAKKMAKSKVIVKRLSAIENFGSMNILCCDKTGTLTAGNVRLHTALAPDGSPSEYVLHVAAMHSALETGFNNPIDTAIKNAHPISYKEAQKYDEVPYDFVRKRQSVLLEYNEQNLIVSKGAVNSILSICSSIDMGHEKNTFSIESYLPSIIELYNELSSQGLRTLGVAIKNIGSLIHFTKEDEKNMTFIGFLTFYDPPKDGVIQAIQKLSELGISLKIISGDNAHVVKNIAQQVGIIAPRVITGADLRSISDAALFHLANQCSLFAEVEPNQKERIIMALKKSGNSVGFMGDGINDASALHNADVGISVDTAVDVAKEAADIVLLEKDLAVLSEGVIEGRRTFANTMKYIFMATSANFGNMFSMAGASLFLSFLPLVPKQILLMNLLTDLPEMTIAMDNVDKELIQKPQRWDISFIRKFMVVFGLMSSFFDYITFIILLFFFHTPISQFRTGWFLESIASACLVVLVVRSRRPFFKSLPGFKLLIATIGVLFFILLFPATPLATLFGFSPLPSFLLWTLFVIIMCMTLSAEIIKKIFYRSIS